MEVGEDEFEETVSSNNQAGGRGRSLVDGISRYFAPANGVCLNMGGEVRFC